MVRARVYKKIGEYDKALADYDDAIKYADDSFDRMNWTDYKKELLKEMHR